MLSRNRRLCTLSDLPSFSHSDGLHIRRDRVVYRGTTQFLLGPENKSRTYWGDPILNTIPTERPPPINRTASYTLSPPWDSSAVSRMRFCPLHPARQVKLQLMSPDERLRLTRSKFWKTPTAISALLPALPDRELHGNCPIPALVLLSAILAPVPTTTAERAHLMTLATLTASTGETEGREINTT